MSVNNYSNYRRDIDGLRALAILPVVLFHAFPNILPGGFVGVDIFFVISGYLITGILLKDMSSGTYSIKDFYMRRIRRIFPALGLVLLSCLCFGWIILTPEEYEFLGKHTAGGVAFISNFMLWKEVGYFDVAADTKPLLHLWSLGIEEQFYIFWPVLLYLFVKRKWNVMAITLSIGLLSFGFGNVRLGIDPAGAFYSPLTRSWELAVGALLVCYEKNVGNSFRELIQNHQSKLSLVGAALLLVGFLWINPTLTFPGYWALLPVLGAALLILSGPNALINKSILSNPTLVGVGLISFPLYLWHWPILVFARIMYSEVPPVVIQCLLVVVAIILAVLTYFFIEKPIRRALNQNRLVWFLFGIVLCIGLSGHFINKAKGFPSRQFGLLNADPASLAMGVDRNRLLPRCGVSENDRKILQTCFSDPRSTPRLAVWGDSKGEAIFYGLARESSDNATWMMLGNVLPAIPNESLNEKSNNKNRLILDTLIKDQHIEIVLLGTALRSIFGVPNLYISQDLLASKHYQLSLNGLSQAIDILEKNGKKVIFFMDHPAFPDPKSCIGGGMTQSNFLNLFFFRKINPRCSITYDQYRLDSQKYIELVVDLKKQHPKLFVYDPTPLLCDIANNRCEIAKDGQFLYSYGDHLSDYANSLVAKDLLPKIAYLLKNN